MEANQEATPTDDDTSDFFLLSTRPRAERAAKPHSPRPAFSASSAERRRKPRLSGCYPALVRGVDAAGEVFEERTFVENISPQGLFLRLEQWMKPGLDLVVIFRLAEDEKTPAPRVGVCGVVKRVEPDLSLSWGIAVTFEDYNFI